MEEETDGPRLLRSVSGPESNRSNEQDRTGWGDRYGEGRMEKIAR